MKWYKKQIDYKINNKYFENLQNRWADKMNNLTKNLSKKSLVILLILFVTGTGIFFGSLLYRSFNMESSGQFEVMQISKTLPLHEIKANNTKPADSSAVTLQIIKSNIKK